MNSPIEFNRQRYSKLEEIRARGIDPYPVRYDVTHPAQSILDQVETLIESTELVAVAGRITSKRGHGKSGFAHLLDRTGRIQIYVRIDRVGPEAYEVYDQLIEVGDYLGVKGAVFTTRTGETTVMADELTLLSKSLRALPEKWHGLRDIETRYRQRYVDLIINPGVKEVFLKRSRLIRSIQRFMDGEGFIEVETPILQPLYGGALARPFKTHHQALDMPLFMRIADELYLKRLIVGGMERVYEIGHDFRNEGIDRTHNPEFTMLEFYIAYVDYQYIMDLVERLFVSVFEEVNGTLEHAYQDQPIDLTPPWPRIPMLEAIRTHSGIDVAGLATGELAAVCGERGLDVDAELGRGRMIDGLFEHFVQDRLVNPTFITDYPVEISPLAKRRGDDPDLTERFELFICGSEFANAFTELNDPVDQRRRFEEQVEMRRKGDGEAHAMDEDFLRAMEYGMPPTGGCGIGIDRLAMLVTDSANIKDVLLFPHMRREASGEESDGPDGAEVDGEDGTGETDGRPDRASGAQDAE
ncbi:MAG: lysine--tRNA ligase [Gemmatimonadota bacterium]|nr:lysine--tRNA ligase [Gemmatimonadota bacterium]